MLKKLFIPHHGNNYQPHALHPHRLLFHGASAIIIKAFVIIMVLALPSSAWLTPDVMTAESQKIIDLTNDLRSEKELPALQENILLNQAAFDKVQDMLVNQYFAHLSPEKKNIVYWLKTVGYGYAAAGENLAMGFSSAQNVVTAWIKSKTHYANITDPDFKEIGVAMVSGDFKDRNTTMVAQYFGTPKVQPVNFQALVPVTTVPQQVQKIHPALLARQSIKGVKITYNTVTLDTEPPMIDLTKTKIWLTQASGSHDKIIRVEAFLSDDTDTAQVEFQNITIPLEQNQTDSLEWTGSAIISAAEVEQNFSPVVLATLTAADVSGNTLTTDINWENFEVIKPSLVQQYLFIKNSQSRNIQTLLNFSRIYFVMLLILSIIGLFLNIFIEIKKQHPHIIASTLALIVLLFFLIIV